MQQTAVVVVLAVGVTYGIISGEIDVSVGAVMGLAAVSGALVMQAGYGWVVGILVCLAVGFGFGLLNGLITVYFSIPSFLVTLGMMAVAQGLALIVTNTRPVTVRDPTFLLTFGGDLGPVPMIVVWAVTVILVGHFVLKYARFGRHVYATGDDEVAARFTGISTGRVKISTLTISGCTAGIAAMLMIGRLGTARPTMGTGLELPVIAAVIIGGTALFGGRGTIYGTVIGALLLSVINNGLVLHGFGSSYQEFIRGIVIVLAVVYGAPDEGGDWL